MPADRDRPAGTRAADAYASLGVRRVVNADARLTRLGGSLMPEPVLAAMAGAAGSHVDMFDLQRRVGERLAELTGNQAAHVATGAAAGLVLTTLACRTGTDPEAIARVTRQPAGADGLPDEVVIHRAHRIPYDPAIALAGGRLVEIGGHDGTRADELEAALGPRTAAVLYVAGVHLSRGTLGLEQTIAIAHARGVPVIVDAAAQLPPETNLWRFTRDLGADVAVFSGGKDLRGPQASGLIVGRAELIAGCAANSAPHQRLARAMKVGKEEMVGLLAAVEWYLAQDHRARIQGYEDTVRQWVERFAGYPGVAAERQFPNEAGQPSPRALLRFDPGRVGLTGAQVREALWDGEPSVAVAAAGPDAISMTPDTLSAGEEELVADCLARVLDGASARAARAPARG